MNQPDQIEYYIGVMSGTSLDGIDVVLVSIEHNQCQMISHHSHPMPEKIKQKILAMCSGQFTTLKQIGELDHQLGLLFSEAVLSLLNHPNCPVSATQIRAIGNHGQTLYHQPDGEYPFTLQLGDANLIAAKTGIDTIADFRRKDMAYGGQGAPLVPAFHRTLFAHTDSCLVVLNIGGIANISVINPDQSILGYDTGPGNVLIDSWCMQHQGTPFDRDARFAQRGCVQYEWLLQMQHDEYFSRPAPKSTGREYFNHNWITSQLKNYSKPLTPEDVQRTLTELTAVSICEQVKKHQYGTAPSLLVCGGGAQNPLIMQQLKKHLPHWQVATTEQFGIDSEFMEAMAFAWLAYRRIHDLPSNLPQVTGARKEVSLGVIYLADKSF